jgi:cation diffusion facilitator CzcD-associated flavoprotein CzcO
MPASPNGQSPRTPSVVIVGAGMSGICMGIKLKQAGIDSFTIFEKAAQLGGTWRDNTYPGLVCDIPSRYYSYSFEPNPDWSRLLSPGDEIWRYLERVADKYGIRSHIRFDTEVDAARYEDGCWRVRTKAGNEVEADFLIAATGFLHHPRYPELEGIDTFEGAAFHSARWDHDVELRGKRIGVIGTGSTGVQITCALADVAGKYTLFQRTAQWVYPLPNIRYRGMGARLMRRFPALGEAAYRGYKKFIEYGYGRAVVQPGWQRAYFSATCRLNLLTVRDRELRRKLTPDYHPMCKRLVISGGFYRAIQRPNVELVTERIEMVGPRGVVTTDGRLHELDVLVFATGFDAHAYVRPMELVGEDGVTLDEVWRDGARTYRTIALPRFPNYFMLMGPHSPFGNQSLIPVAENQADYVMQAIEFFRSGRAAAIAPRPEAAERFYEEMRAAMPNTVWVTGCKSWYIGKDGLPENWPLPPERHREMLAELDPSEFELRAPAPVG